APTGPCPALPANARVIARTSQDFFADPQAVAELPGPIDFAFIDGDHRFASVLHDFIALEAHMAAGGVIALHDTWPLDPLTASRSRQTGFYTADAWKIVPCLRAIRPDLRLLTLPAAPTGLTLITGLDPASSVLGDRFEAIIEAFAALPYAPALASRLALVANDQGALDQLMGWRAMAAAK
ncbi:class I SAM-dependent methyltransferase, partial [Rhodospirillum rubrum]